MPLIAVGIGNTVGTPIHDVGHPVAEGFADTRAVGGAAVFYGVVQQGCDGLIFIGAVLQGDGSNGQKVRDVGDVGALSLLVGVGFDG